MTESKRPFGVKYCRVSHGSERLGKEMKFNFKLPASKRVLLQTASLVLMILSDMVAEKMSDDSTREIIRDEVDIMKHEGKI